MEGLSIDEVGDWLFEEGFSTQVVQAFAGKLLCNCLQTKQMAMAS